MSDKKIIMLIGKTMSGKTTLKQYLNRQALVYKKTQAIEFSDNIIDTPGEYLELRGMYRALMVTSVDADLIVLVQDVDQEDSMFAPGIASMFTKPVIGVVTKADIAKDEAQVAHAIGHLERAGAERVFVTSSVEGSGFEELAAYFED